jgi:TonB family protein
MKNLIKLIIIVFILLTGCSQVPQTVNENITDPILKSEPKLIYPINAQKNNIMGTTSIIFIISEEGKVSQTRLHKSSGSKALDLAAENYCKQLVFVPAKENGTPISSTMKWEVKFDLEDLSSEIENKISEVKSLYSKLENSKGEYRQLLEKEILAIHDDCIKNTKDGLKINEYLFSVVKPSIKNEWETLTRNHPLTFLLYHDFISRFTDFDSLNIVKSKMKLAIKQDLQLLNQPNNITISGNGDNAIIIQKIKKFLEINYPEINNQDLDFKIETENNNLS